MITGCRISTRVLPVSRARGRRARCRVATAALALAVLAAAPSAGGAERTAQNLGAMETLSAVAGFEENRGQTDAAVRFLRRGREEVVFLTRDELVMTLRSLLIDRNVAGTRDPSG